jgi:hypothetical protein
MPIAAPGSTWCALPLRRSSAQERSREDQRRAVLENNGGLPTAGRYAPELRAAPSDVHDGAVVEPGETGIEAHAVGQFDRRAADDRDLLELRTRSEGDPLAIR